MYMYYVLQTLELSEMYMKPPHMLSKADSLQKYNTEILSLRILYHINDTQMVMPYLYASVSMCMPVKICDVTFWTRCLLALFAFATIVCGWLCTVALVVIEMKCEL